jgi:hypothetical protein
MENRLKLVTLGPDRRPRLVPRFRGRGRRGGPVAVGPGVRHLGWAERIARRRAVGLGALVWGRLERWLALPRPTLLVASGVGARAVAGPVGRPGRDGRLGVSLRLAVRVDGPRAARRTGDPTPILAGVRPAGEPRRTSVATRPASRLVERLLERVRIIEGGGPRGRIAPILRRRPSTAVAVGESTPTAPGAVGVVVRAPAMVARVLAVPRPPVPGPAPPPRVPQWDQPGPAPMPPKPLSAVMAEPSIAAFPPAVVEQLTDRVVRAIDRRVIAARERFGMGPT